MKKINNLSALPADLKIRNRMLVLAALRDGEVYTAAELSQQTGISRPTVVKSIQFFSDRGLVVSAGKGESTESGGKKPELFRFSFRKLLLAITLWPDYLGLHLCGMDGRRMAALQIEEAIRRTPAEIFRLIAEKSRSMLAEFGFTFADLYGVSLSLSGTIDYAGQILKFCSSFPDWGRNVPVGDYMRQIFGPEVEILIENAGKMTGRTELLRSEAEQNRILVLFSTWGLSACLIEKGHVLNGDNSLIGEVGHMVIDPHDEEVCGCGSRGCAERLLSAARIRRLVTAQGETGTGPPSALNTVPAAQLDMHAVFRWAAAGDRLARQIDEGLARTFACLIRNISLVFDPNVVVFQGDYAHADAYFKTVLADTLADFQYYPEGGAFQLEYNDTPLEQLDVTGAVNYLQRKFFQDEMLYE